MSLDETRARQLIIAAALAGFAVRLAFGLLYWTGKPLTHKGVNTTLKHWLWENETWVSEGFNQATGRKEELPPLVMNEAEGRELLSRLVPLLKAFLQKRVAA